jgi:hypothetical protein
MKTNDNAQNDGTSKNEHSQYIETQLNMIAEVISNAIKHITSIEIKGLTKVLEETIEKLSKNADLLPIMKETVENTVKFLTTDQVNKFIGSIENMPEEEIKKLVYDIINVQYKFLESTYNGFLNFVINKMDSNEDDPQPSEYAPKSNENPSNINKSIRDEIKHLTSLIGLNNTEKAKTEKNKKQGLKKSVIDKEKPQETKSDEAKMKPSEIYFESKKDKKEELENSVEDNHTNNDFTKTNKSE